MAMIQPTNSETVELLTMSTLESWSTANLQHLTRVYKYACLAADAQLEFLGYLEGEYIDSSVPPEFKSVTNMLGVIITSMNHMSLDDDADERENEVYREQLEIIAHRIDDCRRLLNMPHKMNKLDAKHHAALFCASKTLEMALDYGD